MGKILREYLKEAREDYAEEGLVYAPNSIHHGRIQSMMPKLASERIARSTLDDFIEFLFEHSEHCDHITQTAAWDEFREFEYKQLIKQGDFLNNPR